MQCSNCGNTLLPEDEFCPECGHEVKKHVDDKPSRNDSDFVDNDNVREDSAFDDDRRFREDSKFDDDRRFREDSKFDDDRRFRDDTGRENVNDFNDSDRDDKRGATGASNNGPSAQEKFSQTMKNIQSSDYFKEAVDFLKVSLFKPASLVKSDHNRQIKVPLIVIAALIFIVSLLTFIALRIGTSGLSEFYGSTVIPFSVFFNLFLILVGAFAIFFVLLFIMNQFFLREKAPLVKLAHDYLALSVTVIGIWVIGLIAILVTLVEIGMFLFLLGVAILLIIPLYMFMIHLREGNGKFDTFHTVLIYSVLAVSTYLIIVRLLIGQMIGPAFFDLF